MRLIKKIIKSKPFIFLVVVGLLFGATVLNPLIWANTNTQHGIVQSSRDTKLSEGDTLESFEKDILENSEQSTSENSEDEGSEDVDGDNTELSEDTDSKYGYIMGVFHTKSDTDFVLKDSENKPIILNYKQEDFDYISNWRAGEKLIIEYTLNDNGEKVFNDIIPGNISKEDLESLLAGEVSFNNLGDFGDDQEETDDTEEAVEEENDQDSLNEFFADAGFDIEESDLDNTDFISGENAFRETLDPVTFDNGVSVVKHPVEVEKSNGVMFIVSWAPGEGQKVVPDTDEVLVEIETPSGTLITPENIERYGTVWRESRTYFYCINLSYSGTWNVVMSKDKRDRLGVGSIQAIPVDGVAKVDYAEVKVVEGKMAAVWNIEGIPDDNYMISIEAKRDKDADLIPLTSLSSVSDGIRKKGKTVVSTSKLQPGVYDIYFIVKNIDLTQDYMGVARKTTKDEYILREIEIK